ncbi:MAG TPA: cytochrome c [Dongiaceae bacterium]|jgi:cytochrome c556|nr:cytochrome c [Dongiaceae bacterium]
MNINKKRLIIGIFGLTALIGVAVAEDAIKFRQDRFDQMKDAAKAISAVTKGSGAPADALAPAQKIAEIAKMIPDMFPQGSDQGKTGARPEIWQNREGFAMRANNLETAAQSVVAAAQANDLDGVKKSFQAVGEACGACHMDFKKKE